LFSSESPLSLTVFECEQCAGHGATMLNYNSCLHRFHGCPSLMAHSSAFRVVKFTVCHYQVMLVTMDPSTTGSSSCTVMASAR